MLRPLVRSYVMVSMVVLLLLPTRPTEGHQGLETATEFTNEWVVRLEGGRQAAQVLAQEMGYNLLGQVLGFPDTYRMVKNDHPPVHKRAHSYLSERLALDARVLWAEQQFIKQRTKRGIVPPIDRSTRREKRWDLSVPSRTNRYLFNDELWDEEWYLQDTRTRPDLPKLDLHVLPVYEQGITGRGVRVCVLDDGVEFRHEDLQHNYCTTLITSLRDMENIIKVGKAISIVGIMIYRNSVSTLSVCTCGKLAKCTNTDRYSILTVSNEYDHECGYDQG
uniref:Peptidase S8 pro-domain domain-containing protein n=1 Tax=Timema tahoe TaxID=61484 RepID=A0A7R9IBM1_9NEOP|nr:unnamed protein product [Timema tahoe]